MAARKAATKKAPAKNHLTPVEKSQIVAMRTAGYTAVAISEKTGRSISSIKRVCSTHKVKAGSAANELLDQAKSEMVAAVASDTALQQLAASQVHDVLAHSSKLRETLLEASEHLTANNPAEALIVARACASWANAIQLTTNATRNALKLNPDAVLADDMPELVISTITDEEVKVIREQQRIEEIEINGKEPALV